MTTEVISIVCFAAIVLAGIVALYGMARADCDRNKSKS